MMYIQCLIFSPSLDETHQGGKADHNLANTRRQEARNLTRDGDATVEFVEAVGTEETCR